MLASLEWLKQYVDINISVAELCDKITRVGLEVDTVEKLGEGLEGVVTGKVMEIHRHPDSDHLWVCMMDYGRAASRCRFLPARKMCINMTLCLLPWLAACCRQALVILMA